jgi:hypothetical protein
MLKPGGRGAYTHGKPPLVFQGKKRLSARVRRKPAWRRPLDVFSQRDADSPRVYEYVGAEATYSEKSKKWAR